MKKIWLLTTLLIGSLLLVWCDNTITTENLSETTQKQSYNFFNDYSELDRSIISWSITYDECVENWWEVTEEDLAALKEEDPAENSAAAALFGGI